MNVRIEYDPTPIRHIAVQCPKCEKWFYGRDITNDRLDYEHQVSYARFKCPVCEASFGGDEYNDYLKLHIEEVDYPDVYKDCLTNKEVWA
jgi:hypothetical protein